MKDEIQALFRVADQLPRDDRIYAQMVAYLISRLDDFVNFRTGEWTQLDFTAISNILNDYCTIKAGVHHKRESKENLH